MPQSSSPSPAEAAPGASASAPTPDAAAPNPFAGRRLIAFIGACGAILAVLAYVGIFDPRVVHYAIMAMGAIWLVALGPVVGLMLYWATTYLIINPFPWPVSLNQAFGVLFFLAWAWWIVLRKVRWPRTRWVAVFAAFFLFALLSAALGESLQLGLVFSRQVITYFLFLLAVASLITSRARLEMIIWVVILFASASALVGLAEFVSGMEILQQHRTLGKVWLTPRPFVGTVRINGTLPNSIVFATFGLYALPFCYFASTESRSVNVRLIVLALSLLIALTALLTYNRQTIIQVAALFLMLIFLFRSRYRYFIALVVALAIAVMAPIVLGTTLQRIQQGRSGWDPSVVERRDKIMISFEIMKHKPLFGVGLGSFPQAWDAYIQPGQLKWLFLERTESQYPDMGYMQLIAETGLVGFALQVGLLLAIAVRLWRERRRALQAGLHYKAGLCNALLSLLGLILVVNFFQDFWHSPRHSLFYALFLIVISRSHAGLFEPSLPTPSNSDIPKPMADAHADGRN